jgi:hypothetical protein
MSQNIILELDSFKIDYVKKWFSETNYNKKYNIIILTKRERTAVFQTELSSFSNLKFVTYDTILNYKPTIDVDLNIYFNFIKTYFKDAIPARFLDREGYLPKYGIGVQSAYSYYTDVAYNVLAFLKEHDISFITFRNTPHESIEWIVARSAEFLNIDIYTCELFVFPWLYAIKKGYHRNRETIFNNLEPESKPEFKKHITSYVNNILGKYENAMPSYEKNRLGRGIFKFYNPFKHLKENITKPHKFYNKTRNFFYYKKHSQSIDLKTTNYFVFFLHFQPERTTLPEGYDFTDQFYAVKVLSKMLPEGVKLLVKEHPSMFTRYSEPKFRSLYNYKMLHRLSNVIMCPLHEDNFNLMDNAMAVITINGTAGIEAYIRQKPVLIFGRNNLKVEGVHGFKDIPGLQSFINDVINNNYKIENVVDRLVNLCHGVTMSGLEGGYKEDIDYYLKYIYQDVAHCKLLSELLEHNYTN